MQVLCTSNDTLHSPTPSPLHPNSSPAHPTRPPQPPPPPLQVLCASNDAHDAVDPIVVPEGVPLGEKISFEGCASP